MTRIGIIIGSTRPNRNGEQVARWVHGIAAQRDDADFELVDLRDYPLPHLDEPLPPSLGHPAAGSNPGKCRSPAETSAVPWQDLCRPTVRRSRRNLEGM